MNFRDDGFHIADMKTQGQPNDGFYDQSLWDSTPPAREGDVWRIRWAKYDGENRIEGSIAGYGIFCPKCHKVHHWTTANNCSQKTPDGLCPHNGSGSCWTWTGSAEAGTLTAYPSLHSVEDRGGCGWHGWLKDGNMVSC